MVIKSCLSCRFHEVKQDEKESNSYCRKENCWSEFSKCIMKKALHRFLVQESSKLYGPSEVQLPG
jgi:hypothetical protein